MAFHVACPITCRRICFCELGFPRKLQREEGRDGFLGDVLRIEEFVKDPWLLKAEANATVQVKVPKVVVVAPPVPPPPPVVVQKAAAADGGGGGNGDGDEADLGVSAQTKRVALQKKAAAASLVAEDFARRFESGEMVGPVKNNAQEEQGQSNVKVMCRLCFGGENEGSERARKMLPCKTCGKKYHRSCLKAWSQNRDLFHWSSWTCPSCRICEVCQRSGDPSKFMFCKRCDGAFHCYCQQPPHKNVSSGPYLCPKHTRCHSCGSTVPGNGLSVRWFLGYTCCDACGRLFVKGNYCPVCLKVYRDSESTPMVCCDVCQRWVHCQCDGISDSKYLQFQADGNLQYACPTCRGECYQIRNPEEAVQELWRRRNEADKDLIANLRAAAGLPTQEEIFSISPFSDDEENAPVVMKNEYGRSLKFSLKGVVDKSPKKNKEYGKRSLNKKYGKKKGHLISLDSGAEEHQNLERHGDTSSFGYNVGDNRNEEMHPSGSGEPDGYISPVSESLNEGMCSVNQAGVLKHKFIDEVTASDNNRAPKAVKIKSNKPNGGGLNNWDDTGNQTSVSRTTKGPKLVIHLGTRNRNLTSSPRSDGSSYQKDQDMTTSNGSEDMGHPRKTESVDTQENAAKFSDGKVAVVDQKKGLNLRGKERNLIKIKKARTEVTDMPSKFAGAKFSDGMESVSALNTRALSGKKSRESSITGVRTNTELQDNKASKLPSIPAGESTPGALVDMNDDSGRTPVSHSQKESKPLLKLKFKNPISANQSSWASFKEDEKSSVKGQRSKRKRPSPSREKMSTKSEDDTSRAYEERTMDEIMDANWILQKLGKDAIGKRVEVHQSSDNSWHRGTVIEVFEGTSTVSVKLDNGKAKNLELGKQGQEPSSILPLPILEAPSLPSLTFIFYFINSLEKRRKYSLIMDENHLPRIANTPNPNGYALSGKIMLSAIVVLFFIVVLMVALHLYAKWYLLRERRRQLLRRRRMRSLNNSPRAGAHVVFYVDNNPASLILADQANRGLEPAMIGSLPVFVFNSKTHPEAMDCAVCLSEFEEDEKGRLLPKCNHAFHVECIDMWFHSHSTCPICRAAVEPVLEPAMSNLAVEPEGIKIEPPGSSSGVYEEGNSSSSASLGSRRKGLDLTSVRIEVPPMRSELEYELPLSSPASHGFRSPGTRLLSLKRILSMGRKTPSAPTTPCGVGTSCRSGMTQLDLEKGPDELTQTPVLTPR